MLKNKYKLKLAIVSVLMVTIFSLSVISRKEQNVIETIATTSTDNKIEWGIKRNNNHMQPDVGTQNKKVLEENGGICLGNKDKKYVYLTFDAGYEAGYTKNILQILKENEVPATFFITAHYLNTQEELVKQMLEEGHLVGNHTVNHKSMPELTDEQIKKEVMDLHQAVYEKFAYDMRFLRPPKGEYSERSVKATNALGYKTVMWSFAYEDWDENKQPSEDDAKEKILSNVHNGEIMLLHSNSKTNMSVLSAIIKEIESMGYEFKSLDSFE